jgi:hypothetical protein
VGRPMGQVTSNIEGWRQVLLLCGTIAPPLHLATDRLAGILFKGYDFSAQSISDLSASGSPVRLLVVLLTSMATVTTAAFAMGVWELGSRTGLARVVAALIVGHALLGLVAIVLFPTKLGERPAFGSPGVILMFLSVLCFVLAMVLGAAAFSGWMRVVSIVIPAAYVLLAVVRYATAGSAETVSLIGTQERTMAYSFLVWMFALAVHLLS